MANNIVGETAHHPTPIIRSTTTNDSDNYQQCNYQTFQMLVHSVVDQLNSNFQFQFILFIDLFFHFTADEVRIKHLQNISDNIEVNQLISKRICIDFENKN